MAQITELIDKQDNVELIRDTIWAILTDEIANQRTIAEGTAGKDPRDWDLRIHLERNNPVSDFLDPELEQKDNPPVINIQLDSWNMDASKSNQVERQGITAVYHIDCYGFGQSVDVYQGGHIPGDQKSALEAQRAVKLVRNILMSSFYTYLGLPRGGAQSIWRRWIDSVSVFQPQLDNRSAQHVMAARMQFNVEFSEFSPQYQAMLLEIVSTTVKRSETDETYFVATYDYT